MPSLTRAHLASTLHERIGLNKTDAMTLVDDLLDLITETLISGEKVKLSGFGTFDIRQKGTRPGRNPRTKESITIEERRVVTFRPSKLLRGAMNRRHQATVSKTEESP